jgi:hypothetical protein
MPLSPRVPGNWFCIDFHVHSPASRDFGEPPSQERFGGEEKAYLWLVEQAKQANLDIMVITDHNDIKGYQRLRELESDLRSTRRTLLRAESVIPPEVQAQIDGFDQVVILPGVEFDADPNIHLLVLFDPQKPLDEASDFLTRGGYPEDLRGQEVAARSAKWNAEAVYQEAGKIGAIVIAAHTDSSKGLYEASKKWGQKRIAAFSDEGLFGMEFLKPISRDQIQSILRQPDYVRNTHLAFVQSSDFHGKLGDKLGERRTWVRLDGAKREASDMFIALKKALRNPDEYVSAPERPEIREIQRRLEDKPALACLDTEQDVRRLLEYACAFANSEDGTIVIGRNDQGNWLGIECVGERDIEDRIKTLLALSILELTPQNLRVQVYPYYSNKFFATVRVSRQSQICSIAADDRVYILENGAPRQASIPEVVHFAEERLLQRYSRLSISPHLNSMSRKLRGLRDSLDVLPIVRKIETKSTPFSRLFSPPTNGDVLSPDLRKTIEMNYNGVPDGQAILLAPERPRLPDRYIRFTAPMGTCDLSSPLFDGLKRFSGEKIIIGPLGVAYFDNHDDVCIFCEDASPTVLQVPIEDSVRSNMRFVAAYLKSSIALWYSDRCLGSTDLRNGRVLANLPVPNVPTQQQQDQVHALTDRLADLERTFLLEELDAVMRRPSETAVDWIELKNWEEQRLPAVTNHNNEAEKLMSQIDQTFFELFGFSREEIEIVEQGIEALGLKIFLH